MPPRPYIAATRTAKHSWWADNPPRDGFTELARRTVTPMDLPEATKSLLDRRREYRQARENEETL